MNRFFIRLLLSTVVLSFGACKSFELLPNGYMVKGYPYYMNIDERITVQLDSTFSGIGSWTGQEAPLSAAKLSLAERKLLKKLGYATDAYAVLFKNTSPMDYKLIALVNTKTVSPDGQEHLLDMSRMQRKVTDSGKWFEERLTGKNDDVYHAVIPVSEKLFSEKYLSLIYMLSDEGQYATMARMVEANVSKFRDFYPFAKGDLKPVESCPNDTEVHHHGYEIPESLHNTRDYMLLKATDKAGHLVYYTLLRPGIRIGAFRICTGSYTLSYTTLQGVVVWQEEIVI